MRIGLHDERLISVLTGVLILAPIMKLGEVPTQQLVASVVFPKMEEKELDLNALSICGAAIAGTTASVDTPFGNDATTIFALKCCV